MNNTVQLFKYFGVYYDLFFKEAEAIVVKTLPENDSQRSFAKAVEALQNEDADEALAMLRESGERGHALAAYGLGVCLVIAATGDKAESTFTEAVEWLTFAAELGRDEAMLALAFFYLAEDSPFYDEERSTQWFRQAAHAGNEEGMYEYGCCYLAGRGIEQDYAKAAAWFEKGAELDNTLSQFELGVQYTLGEGVDTDIHKAIELFKKAADKKHPGAMAALAQYYYDGRGVEQDYNKAFKLFFSCYLEGNPKGNLGLAHFYMDDEIIAPDYQAVLHLLSTEQAKNFPPAIKLKNSLISGFLREAEKGDLYAYTQLGWAILNGYIEDYNQSKAYDILSIAAENKEPLARCLLRCYLNEQGNPNTADTEECIKFFKEQMESGIAWAARELLYMAFRKDFEATEEEISSICDKAIELGDFFVREHFILQYEKEED